MRNLRRKLQIPKKEIKKVRLGFVEKTLFSLFPIVFFSLVYLGFKEAIFEESQTPSIFYSKVEVRKIPVFIVREIQIAPLYNILDTTDLRTLRFLEILKQVLNKPIVNDDIIKGLDTVYIKTSGRFKKLSVDSLYPFSVTIQRIKEVVSELEFDDYERIQISNFVEFFLRPNLELAFFIEDTVVSRIVSGDSSNFTSKKRFDILNFFLYFFLLWLAGFLVFKNLLLRFEEGREDKRKVSILGILLLLYCFYPHINIFPEKLGIYFLPAAGVAGAFFFGFPVAFALYLFSFLLLMPLIILKGSISAIVINLLTGFFSVFLGLKMKKRWDFLYIFIILTTFLYITFAIFSKSSTGSIIEGLKFVVLFSSLNVLILLLVIPLLEWVFKYPTEFVLLELSNFNHPLLLSLQQDAPGTFEHSLRVAEMGARVAPIIGVSPLLARVAGLYHDIGKKSHSFFFVENQKTMENPHDKLTPEMSVQILKSHVVDGINLAKKYRLPDEVVRVIATHHGTSVMYSFYKKAMKAGGEVDKDKFRYPGPKPQNKMETLLMIIDSLEASSRALEEKNEEKFRELIRDIIGEKVEDGQFSETNLTYAELEKIKEELLKVLLQQYHLRIKYHEDKGY